MYMKMFQHNLNEMDEHIIDCREGGKWTVNLSEPPSLDYTNPRLGYRGDSLTGCAYFVLLEHIKTTKGLLHTIEHLSGKAWFDPNEFLIAVGEALDVRY